MPRKKETETVEKKIEGLEKNLEEFKEMETKIEKIIEDKVYEIRTLAYLILIIVMIIFAIAVGAIAKSIF